jgi:hypothetical protein
MNDIYAVCIFFCSSPDIPNIPVLRHSLIGSLAAAHINLYEDPSYYLEPFAEALAINRMRIRCFQYAWSENLGIYPIYLSQGDDDISIRVLIHMRETESSENAEAQNFLENESSDEDTICEQSEESSEEEANMQEIDEEDSDKQGSDDNEESDDESLETDLGSVVSFGENSGEESSEQEEEESDVHGEAAFLFLEFKVSRIEILQ